MMAAPEPSFTLAYILGTGHCGSTLLSLLLNAHSRMIGLSSLRKIDFLVRPPPGGVGLGGGILDHEFWQRVRARYEQETGRSFDSVTAHHPSWKEFVRWNRERLLAWTRDPFDLMSTIARESGRPILVDSSKAWQQLYLLKRSGRVRIRVLHTLRDGRAVFHSYDRKYHNFPFSFGQWAKPSMVAATMRPLFSSEEWMPVRYEELVTEPERVLTSICAFLGADYEPSMLRYRSSPWIGILGNRMAQRTDETIRLDEKWKRDLPRNKQLLFDLLGGPLNRYFGYAYLGRR